MYRTLIHATYCFLAFDLFYVDAIGKCSKCEMMVSELYMFDVFILPFDLAYMYAISKCGKMQHEFDGLNLQVSELYVLNVVFSFAFDIVYRQVSCVHTILAAHARQLQVN